MQASLANRMETRQKPANFYLLTEYDVEFDAITWQALIVKFRPREVDVLKSLQLIKQ